MFTDEELRQLQELVRRVPLQANVRIRYTRSALLLTTNLPNLGTKGLQMLLLFLGALISLGALMIGAGMGYIGGLGLGALAITALLMLYGIVRVNNQVDAGQYLPPNFIVDTATRRITLPAPDTWWPVSARPNCHFEDVTRVEARLVWFSKEYGEIAEVRVDFTNGYPQTVLSLSSYAVAQQLATVLQQIISPPPAGNPAAAT